MASYDPNFLSQHELCCPICFEEYEDNQNSERLPKLLMCLHTLCVACISSIRNPEGTVLCPICRTEHADVALTDLYDNYIILNYLKKQQTEQDAVMARQKSGTTESDFSLDVSSLTSDQAKALRLQQFYDEGGEDPPTNPVNHRSESTLQPQSTTVNLYPALPLPDSSFLRCVS